jgi:hypothetical protein
MRNKFFRDTNRYTWKVVVWAMTLLPVGFQSSAITALSLDAQSAEIAPATPSSKLGKATHYQPNPLSRRAESFYELVWGWIQSLLSRLSPAH